MSHELTGLVITKNEEAALPECLDAWRAICQELIVVDDGSSDHTREIARECGAVVLQTDMDPETGFAGLRNKGLELVTTDQVMVFDADERPTEELLGSIRSVVEHPVANVAYRVHRRNNAFNHWIDHGSFSPDDQVRLLPRGIRYIGAVHEIPDLKPEIKVLDLDGVLEHFTYANVREYWAKMHFYAQIHAREMPPPSLRHMVMSAPHNFIKRGGYKDGLPGLTIALGSAWYEHLVRKYYLAEVKKSNGQ